MLANQTGGGGFGLWGPDGGDPWLDAYATDFLARARALGYAVPDRAFDAALLNLRNTVNAYGDFEQGGEDLAYALMVLAREGEANIGDLRYYADTKARDFASPLAKAQLGLALAAYGDQVRADRMFGLAADQSLGPVDDTLYRADYGSGLRDAAGVLALSAEAGSQAPDRAALIARVTAPDSETRSTQENLWTLLAAQALMDQAQAGLVTLDGVPVAGPALRLGEAALRDGPPIEIANPGDTATELVLTAFGIPDQPEPAGGNGYRMTRQYFTLEGEEVALENVARNTRLVAVLTVTPERDLQARLMVNDPLPAGFEIDNPDLLRAGDLASLAWLQAENSATHTEFRADRFLAAVDWGGTEPFTLAYAVRAISVGDFHHPAASVADMYRPAYGARTDAGRATVVDAPVMLGRVLAALCLTLALGVLALDRWIGATVLPALDVATSQTVLARDGTLLRAYTVADGRWRLAVAPTQVDRGYLAQLVAYEDRRFYRHPGVDPLALLRALSQAARHGRLVSGGSTLTMQVARLLEAGPTGQWAAKLRQIRVALALERRLDKAQILGLYLELAPYGGNIEGLRAASLAYFGKEPTRLTPAESALLVALPQAPETRRPDRFPEAARSARDRALDRAAEAGVISPDEAAAARGERPPTRRAAFPMLAPALADRLTRARPATDRADDDPRCRPASQAGGSAGIERGGARSAPVRRADRRRPRDRRDPRLGRIARLSRHRPAGFRRHDPRDPLARIDAEAADLWPGLRRRHRPSRNADRGSPGAVRRLCAAKLRQPLSRHADDPRRAATIAEHPRRHRSRRRRPRASARPSAPRRRRSAIARGTRAGAGGRARWCRAEHCATSSPSTPPSRAAAFPWPCVKRRPTPPRRFPDSRCSDRSPPGRWPTCSPAFRRPKAPRRTGSPTRLAPPMATATPGRSALTARM